MKFFLPLALLISSTLAQSIAILSPPSGATISSSSPFVIDIHEDVGTCCHTLKSQSTSSREEINFIIAIKLCDDDPCNPDTITGPPSNVVYNGPFNAQFDPAEPEKGHHQNFTFDIPEGISGSTLVSVVHVLGIGAVFTPFLEIANVDIDVV